MQDRKYKRISFVSQAMVMVGNQTFEGLTTDLSLNGLFVSTDHHIPVGEIASISLKIPSVSSGSTLTLNGVVVRNSVRGMGLQFKALSHETFSCLKTVINRKPWSAMKNIADSGRTMGFR